MFELADLLKLAENNRIKIETCRLPFGINSIYTELKECPAIICLEQSLSAPQIKIELALCLGYYFLRGQKQLAKEEKRSRAEEWAYSKLAPVEIFTQAFAAGASDIEGIANYAGVTPEFIKGAAQYYTGRLGPYITLGSFCVIFEPLSIVQKF